MFLELTYGFMALFWVGLHFLLLDFAPLREKIILTIMSTMICVGFYACARTMGGT